MNKRLYRKDRVRLTDKIKRKAVSLIIREKDIEKKKKHTANWYRDKIAKTLKLTEEKNPSLRSYESMIQCIRKSLQSKNPIEGPWNLGILSSKYKEDFSPEILPVIIKVQKLMMQSDWAGPKILTIRYAQWIARLYHSISEISASRHLSERAANLFLWMIISEYANNEEWEEIIGNKDLDTSSLDEEVFLTEKFWGLPIDELASRYAVTQSLLSVLREDYGLAAPTQQ